MNFFEDGDVQAAFVEENKSDFWDWCRDNNVSPKRRYHKEFCTSQSYQFLEFIEEYKDDLVLDEADKRNDLLKENA